MAEVTGLRNNALPYPVYGAPWGLILPILDADGDLVTGASSPDTELTLNGDTFADATNEVVEIATNSGMYYILLTAANMTADIVAGIVKCGTAGAKTTPFVLYPRKLVTLQAGTVGANASDGTTLQLDSGAVALDDYYNGCLLVGTLDSNVEARIISDYVGSTKVCTVSPAFVTTPDNNDTFVVYLPEGKQIYDSNAAYWNKLATVELPLVPTTAGRKLDVSTTGEAGVDWANVGSPTTTVGLSGTTIKTVTDVEAKVDTIDDFVDTEVAAILAAVDTEVAAIKVITDALTAVAAAKLALTMGTATPAGTVDTTVPASSTEFEAANITEATADHYKGRIVLFTSGAMLGQASDITAYALAGGKGHFTVTAMTEAPANNVTFVIL